MTALKSRRSRKKKIFKNEEIEEDPSWFNLGDSCYFFQFMICDAAAETEQNPPPIIENRKRRKFLFSKQ
jgi:hypothetical protein